MLQVPLTESFRYVHEPLHVDETAVPMLGNATLVEELKRRLRMSQGGTFLITGFRGVGKTTIVTRALEEIGREIGGDEIVVPIVINVARPTTPERLLFALVRRVYEALQDRGALPMLAPAARQALLLAHVRTWLGLKQTQSDLSERTTSLTLGLGEAAGALAGPAALLAPEVGVSRRRGKLLATEASFLAYAESDAEYDLARIVGLLDGRDMPPEPPRRGLIRRRSAGERKRVHLVIVLDEVDKLTATPAGVADLEGLLSGLKNTLTMRGAHFLVVAGPDMHDHAVRDAGRGNSVYESIFAWRMYVPCTWDAPDRLVHALTGVPPIGGDPGVERLMRYLRFKARGVPRRLLQEFGELVVWQNGRPLLSATGADFERITFYARLEELIDGYFRQGGRQRLFPVPIDEDRWRLGGYYAMDWILRSEGEPFTARSIVGSPEQSELDPLLRIAQPAVERLLRHLARHGVLTVLREPGIESTLYGDAELSRLASYKLADDVKQTLLGIAFGNESERAALDLSAPPVAVTQTGPIVLRPGEDDPASAPPGSYASYHHAWTPPGTPGPPDPAPPLFAGPYPQPPSYGQPAPPSGQPAPPYGRPAPSYGPPPENPFADTRSGPEPRLHLRAPRRTLADRYDLTEVVGQGGMSTVYRAYDRQLGRTVAAKLLRADQRDNAEMARRFRRELKIAQRLSHPGVVRTYDVVEDAETGPVLIMEFVEGRTLSEVVRGEGPLPPARAVRLAATLAETLEYLEGENLTRLDLKPANVIVHPARGPVIIDFGIAKSVVDATVATNAGDLVGTPSYISPEAIRGDRVDIRSDIYALGVIACYTLTGRLPYRTDSVAAVLHAIATGDLDYAHLPVTEELRDVIRRATARLPEDRYQHPAEFRDALLATPEATEEPPTEEMPARDAATPSWDPFPDDMPTRRVPRELVPAVPPEPILPGEPETWSEMSRWPRTGRPEATREPEPGEGPAPEQEEAATPDEPTDEPSEEPRPHEDHEPTESTREPEPEPEHEPPLVYGVTCEEGHFTDPRPPFCAVCRGLLPEQALVQGPRPPLGELRLDDGRTLPLTRNYVIGRIPEETPEAESGAHTPVQLTDPGQSISRRHVTVTLDGWDVLFTDLGSANGTYVRPPGDADFYEIPPNEPVQLGPGCTIRVGIERTLTLAGRRDPGPR